MPVDDERGGSLDFVSLAPSCGFGEIFLSSAWTKLDIFPSTSAIIFRVSSKD